MEETSTFPILFKKYRLRAEFSRLSELGLALAENGFLYEDSIFSRWQKGNRIPKNRALLIALIKLFISRRGINSLKEANEFLAAAEQGYLTDTEIQNLPGKLLSHAPFQVPAEITHFTGREVYIEKIKEVINNGGILHIHGLAGIGKTALAIKTGHLLRHAFPDGVLWYRLDTSDTMSILSGIAQSFGENINEIKNVETRASLVRSIISSKKLLLILDNAELDSLLYLLLPNSSLCSVIITSKYKNLEIPTPYSSMLLKTFTQEESLSIFRKILGKRYVARNTRKLLEIADDLGNLPLAVSIFAKQITQSSKNIQSLFSYLKKEKLQLESLRYEDKNLYASLHMSFNGLKTKEKNIFISLCVFAGKDFSIEAVAAINKLDMLIAEKILETLIHMSLVEKSTNKRYRTHPLVKVFIQEKLSHPKLYLQAIKYYEKLLKRFGRGNAKFYPQIEIELENIIFLFNKSYSLQSWQANIVLWEYIGVFLWDTGRWEIVNKLGQCVYDAAIKGKNDYAQALCCIRELSWLYYWRGKLQEAVQWAEKGLKIANRLQDSYLIAYAKQRLGKIYQGKQEYLKSEMALNQSVKMFKKLNDYERLGDTLTYLGELYIITGNLQKSEIYLKKALKLTEDIHDSNQHAIALGYFGEINYLKKNYKYAKDCFEKSLSTTYVKGVNVGGKVWCNIGLALIGEKLGNKKETYTLLHIAQENIVNLGIWYDQSHPLMIEYKRLSNSTFFLES